MRHTVLAAITFLFAYIPCHSFAIPTVVGLQAATPADTASVYTDTTNDALLWVTPPTRGRLTIVTQSLAIDEPTCQTVASLYRTRRSMSAQLETYNQQIESIQVAISGLIQSARANPASLPQVSGQLSVWQNILDFVKKERNKTAKLMSSNTVAHSLLFGAGYYALIATSGWDDALRTVRARNSGMVVNPINTSAAQLNISVVGAKGSNPTS